MTESGNVTVCDLRVMSKRYENYETYSKTLIQGWGARNRAFAGAACK